MPRVAIDKGIELNCEIDDFLWPWTAAVPVLMVHGHARSARFWERWVPTLSDAHRVYRLDQWGCGGSTRPPEGPRFEPPGILGHILAAMDALALERVHWVGESSSGVLGLAFAATYPQRVASLVLCDTPYKIPDSLKPSYALGQASTADAILEFGTREWCRRTLQNRLDLDRAGPELQAWYIEEMGKTPSDVAAAYNRCFESVDLKPMLGSVNVPALLLGGTKSKIAGEQLDTLAKDLPRAKVRRFEGYGHGVSVIAAEECAREAVAFWRALGT
jgi:pimeloyl-ACP methyl ester carboxylesterase